MELIERVKYIVEKTNLFIQINGINPNIISNWGRAKSIDLVKKTIHFRRQEILTRRMGSERSSLSDAFLRTEIEFSKVSFEIIRNYCQEDGSWQKYKMDELRTASWEELYEHIRNRTWWTKFQYCVEKFLKQ